MFDNKKDLLGLSDMSAEGIERILQEARMMRFCFDKKSFNTNYLQGRSMVTLFYENSTRTRLSFDLAAKYTQATAATIIANTSSVSKGESLIDTAKTIEAQGVDFIVIRHSVSGAPHLMAKNVSCSIINAGDGMNEHPTQALLDIFTIMQKKGRIRGLKVAIVGDIAHSRVARSNIYGLTTLGAQVSVGGPATLIPPGLERLGVSVYHTSHEAVIDADVIIVLRLQLERQKQALFPSTSEYARFFGINKKRLALAKPDCLLMHPGPINRGIELTSEIVDGAQSVINEQVTNGVALRMAVLHLYARR